MVTTLSKAPVDYDRNTRDYIQLIRKTGGLPKAEERPEDFGPWDTAVLSIEHSCFQSPGDIKRIEQVIEALCRSDKELATLLALQKEVLDPDEKQEPLYPPLPASAYLPPNLSRGACPWLDEYVAFSKKWSPRGYEDYHEATGISLMSAVAAHRVALPYGEMEYTPLYIALVGFTTLFKKTTTARLYYGLLHAAGLDWMLGADISTPQKLLSNMTGKTIPANYDDMHPEEQEYEEKRLAMAGQRGWYYDEFGLHLDQMVKENGPMSDFKGLLRILDDCKPTFRYDTHARGNEKIEKPYLSLLAGMTPADIKPHAKKDNKFWRDGLFARFAFVCAPTDAKSKRDRFPKERISYPDTLVKPLQGWHEWLGVPKIKIETETNKAGTTKHIMRSLIPLGERECISSDEVDDAIERYEFALLDIIESKQIHESLYGNYGRLHKIALRVAMLCASFENKGRIEMRHWAKGQEFAEARRCDLHELFTQVNDHKQENTLEDDLIDYLQSLNETRTSVREIKQLGPNKLRKESAETLRKHLDECAKSGMVELERIPGKIVPRYWCKSTVSN